MVCQIMLYSYVPQLICKVTFNTDLFEVRYREQLLDFVKEIRNEGLEGRVKTVIEDFLRIRKPLLQNIHLKTTFRS